MLNLAEHEICPANMKLLTNSFLLNIAEHENFSVKMQTIEFVKV